MVEPRTLEEERSGGRGGSHGWYRELVELAALFLAVALADLFANTLAHRPLGAVALIIMGVLLLLSAVLHRRYTHHRDARRRDALGRSRTLPRAVRATRSAAKRSRGAAGGSNLWRVRTVVRDNPGSLAALAASLAGHGLDIRSIQVHAVADGIVDELLLEAPPSIGWRDIVTATETGGGRDVHAIPADIHDLVDVPTRVLTLACHALDGQVPLPAALRALLGASSVRRGERTGEGQGDADTVDGPTMRLSEPAGGVLTFERPTVAFTPAEFARARAFRDLCRGRVRTDP
jgi:membrane protein implicated in regulation of membrane protease activity